MGGGAREKREKAEEREGVMGRERVRERELYQLEQTAKVGLPRPRVHTESGLTRQKKGSH